MSAIGRTEAGTDECRALRDLVRRARFSVRTRLNTLLPARWTRVAYSYRGRESMLHLAEYGRSRRTGVHNLRCAKRSEAVVPLVREPSAATRFRRSGGLRGRANIRAGARPLAYLVAARGAIFKTISVTSTIIIGPESRIYSRELISPHCRRRRRRRTLIPYRSRKFDENSARTIRHI